jgi:hypothetical protein
VLLKNSALRSVTNLRDLPQPIDVANRPTLNALLSSEDKTCAPGVPGEHNVAVVPGHKIAATMWYAGHCESARICEAARDPLVPYGVAP